jgi:PAS domain S-box-containing protein
MSGRDGDAGAAPPLRVLLVEDSRLDAALIEAHLAQAGLSVELHRVDNDSDFGAALARGPYDLILSDYRVPGFEGPMVLSAARLTSPEIPFLFVSGALGEDRAIELLKRGATDFIVKDRLERLAPSIERALREAHEKQHRRVAQEALRASEERARGILAALAEGIIVHDGAGRIREVNASAARLLGVPAGELVGRTPADARWRAVRENGLAMTAEEHPAMVALRTGAGQIGTIMGIRRPDDSTVWLSVNAQPLFEADGRTLAGVVSSFSDVTDRKRAIEEMRTRVEFEQQLVGIVSHDLRNPLNVIKLSCASLLRQEDLDARTAKTLARIQTSTERAARMIHDLLDFTQARLGGGIPLQPRAAALHEVVLQVVEEARIGAPERQILLEQSGDADGQWDPDRLAQVASNLVGNALAYGAAGTPVRVETRGEPERALLLVHNEGTPIAPELLPHLFEPLRRGEGATGRQTRSIGLGLYIVDHIVRAHGGRISVQSTAEAGTTFTVELPRRPAA